LAWHPVYGIPHPSACISNDDWGAIATYLASQFKSYKKASYEKSDFTNPFIHPYRIILLQHVGSRSPGSFCWSFQIQHI